MKLKMFLLASVLMVSACGTVDGMFGPSLEKSTLEGDRLSLYDFEKTLQQDPNTQFGLDGSENQNVVSLPQSLQGGKDTEINLVAPWKNEFWPQVGGYPNHAMKHLRFTKDEPKRQWSTSIGAGGDDRVPLVSAPIMAAGKIFALNNDAEVVALDSITGEKIWDADIIKSGEDETVIGGGLAFSGGMIFATNGFNEVVALNPDNGAVLWRTQTKTPIRAAPSAIPGRVFVVTMDNQTLALDSKTGEVLWKHRGLDSDAGVLGASTPAISRDAVIAAYGSGEVYALQIDTGVELWSENLSPLARVAGQTALSDIRALPVIDGGVVYAVSYTNRMNAIDARTGKILWQAPIGSASTPWVSGNRIYVVESQGTLVSLDRKTGHVMWQIALPRYEDMDDRQGIIHWNGPMLAGEQLIVFGSHGDAHMYNPLDGSLINEWDVGSDVLVMPALAQETMYVLGNEGRVKAWK
jgi:outer membrane protein assembly factor BamB